MPFRLWILWETTCTELSWRINYERRAYNTIARYWEVTELASNLSTGHLIRRTTETSLASHFSHTEYGLRPPPKLCLDKVHPGGFSTLEFKICLLISIYTHGTLCLTGKNTSIFYSIYILYTQELISSWTTNNRDSINSDWTNFGTFSELRGYWFRVPALGTPPFSSFSLCQVVTRLNKRNLWAFHSL